MIMYKISREYYNILRNVYEGKKIVRVLSDDEVITYLNTTGGFHGEIESLKVEG